MKLNNKSFYKSLLLLCIPIILQNLISTSVNIIDTMMVSGLGESAIASIGIANQVFFLYSMSLAGISGGASIFISQFYGKNDKNNIKKVTCLTCIIALIVSFIFFFPLMFKSEAVTNIFSMDKKVVPLAMNYFGIIIFSYPLLAISTIFSTSSRSVRNPKLGMNCSLVALIINIIANYLLVYGNFGFPELGVRGSATATLLARIVELSLIIYYVYFYKKDYILKFTFVNFKSINRKFIKSFFSKSLSIFLNDTLWALGTVMYSVAYSKAGTAALASSQIASSTGDFFIITCVCIASGGGIMLGNELGANEIKLAVKYSKKFSVIVTIAGIAMGILLIICIPVLIKIFNVENNIKSNIVRIFLILGVLMPLKSFNTFMIIGILRSGGDTKYAFFLEQVSLWLIALPITFFAAFNGMAIYILFLLTYAEEAFKFIFGVPRVISKKWATNIINDI